MRRDPFAPWRLHSRIAYGALVVSLLAGCTAQRIRDAATEDVRAGRFEQAINGLQAGIDQHPDSAVLRAGLISARSEASGRLIAQAAQLRSSRRYDEAIKVTQRALGLDATNDRLLALRDDLRLEMQAKDRIEEIEALVVSGQKAQALQKMEGYLRDAPRQPEFLALQRRLEAEVRLARGASARRGLAEARPISLDFRGAPLPVVLDAITRGSGINFILDRDVRQDARVTIYLRSATVENALEFVTGAHQLAQRIIDPQTVLIYPNTPEKQREHQEQIIRVFRLSNADAKSVAAMLRSVLRTKEPFVDERVNLVALRETPEVIALAERLVAIHDMGDAEVMLEVEILEISSSRLMELGIQFPSGFSLLPLPAVGATGLTVDSLRNINSGRVGVTVGGIAFNANRQVGDANILANPRIRTKNRERARVLIGDKVPVITSTTNSTGFVAETVNYLDVGLKLDVEPVVSPDDDVTIKLALEVSSIAKEVPTKAGSLAYQIGTRNANTTLRLRDGETQLLAGLISSQERSSANRIPGLGDLPIAGRLFSSQKDDGQRTELVLAITPRILRGAPRLDPAQAELWVGTEAATRLRPPPERMVLASATSGVGTLPGTTPSTASAAASAGTDAVNKVPAGPARVAWSADEPITSGQEFDVRLQLASRHLLRGVPLEIAYSTDRIEVVDVREGAFFKQGGAPTSFTYSVNAQTGKIGVGVQRNEEVGAAGQDVMLQLRLRAKSPGTAQLQLTSFKPLSSAASVEVGDLPVLRLQIR